VKWAQIAKTGDQGAGYSLQVPDPDDSGLQGKRNEEKV
jgi:hypothetical protein